MKKLFFISLCVLSTLSLSSQTQPSQPADGYGGLSAPYSQVNTFNYDDGATGFMLYIPANPTSDSMPLVVFTHGFGEWNPMRYGSWIDHIVKRGNIVVFPRYQVNEYTTLSTSFTSNTVSGILRALDTLQAHPSWVQPKLNNVFYVGHSYGGLITANLATKYSTYGLPKPKAILMACPGYGQYPGGQLNNYSAMDSSIFVIDIIEKSDIVVDSAFALQVFNQTTSIPYTHKNLVIHYADNNGMPSVESSHGQPSCIDSSYDNGDNGVVMSQASFAYTDATDFYCYWKLFDALEDCALHGIGCTTAFGDTYEQKHMGQWSDSTAVKPLEIRPSSSTAGINNPAKKQFVTIYPNPGNGIFFIETSPNLMAQSIEVFDALGKLVKTNTLTKNATIVDLSEAPKGVYSYRILSNDKIQLSTGKLIVE